MKHIVSIIAVLLIMSCGQKQEVKEKYCGLEMSGFEVMDYKAMANSGYNYSAADKALHAQLTEGVNNLFNNQHEIQIAFAAKDKDKIALFIVAPDDKAIVEKISCYFLQNTAEGLPAARNLMFYTNEHSTLVAAVKTKPTQS